MSAQARPHPAGRSQASHPLAASSGERTTSGASALAIRSYRLLGAVAVTVAIAYQVADGLQHSHFSVADYFSYFTELSNIFAAALFLYGAARLKRRSARLDMLRGASVTYMLTTGIVFAVLLSGHKAVTPRVNAIVHQAMPIAVALDWAIVAPTAPLALKRTLLWMSFPLLYVPYTLIRGLIVHWYPYFFLDPTRHGGYAAVALGCLLISVGILALILATTWAGNRRAQSR